MINLGRVKINNNIINCEIIHLFGNRLSRMNSLAILKKQIVKEQVETRKATIERQGDDVLYTLYKPGVEINITDAQELDVIYTDMMRGQDYFLLADFSSKEADISTEAQTYFSRNARIVPSVKAAAIVIGSIRARIVARFYIQYFKPLYETKIFGNVSTAQEWFESIRKTACVDH